MDEVYKKIRKIIFYIFLIFLFFFIFQSWVGFIPIASGDFLGFSFTQIRQVALVPYAWDTSLGNGFGQFASPFRWYFFTISGLQYILGIMLGLSWPLVERFAYLYPLVILLIVMPIAFYKKLFPKSNFYLFASIIFAFNTYILMLIGGGQIYIALSYSLTPLIFAYYVSKLMKGEYSLVSSFILSLLLSLEVMLDLRITYVLLLGIFLFVVFFQLFSKESVSQRVKMIWFLFVIPGMLTGLTQAFWVLPTLLMHQNPANQLGVAYNSLSAVNFFSFAKFEDSLGLLHPNWPENIFGKVGFMKPEFILLPILAFSSLLFVNVKEKRLLREQSSLAMTGNITRFSVTDEYIYVLFFALLGLIGAFLAKGSQEPFGGIYLWLFGHVPGFVMFRDPTKWYVIIAISYSVLIPFNIEKIYHWLQTREKFIILNLKFLIKSKYLNVQNIFIVVVMAYLLFLIRPALLGQLTGTFKPHEIPQEYTTLENFLSKQNWERTFWVPSVQRYAYNTPQHPAVGAEEFYHVSSISAVLSELREQGIENKLQQAGVKYVVVPYDSEGEIFLKDRKYDNTQYILAIHELQKISWLQQIPGFGRIAIFAVPNSKDHFWLIGKGTLSYTAVDPTRYLVNLQNVTKGEVLVFAESYDKYWIASFTNNEEQITKSRQQEGFNSFVLPKNGNYTLTVFYAPQQWTEIGLWISGISLLGSIIFLLKNFVYTKSNDKKTT